MFKKLALILCLSTGVIYAEDGVFIDDPERAFVFAKDHKKDVLLVFTADWCKYCKIMQDDIRGDLKVVDDMVVCYVDFDSRKDLVENYKVGTIPDSMVYEAGQVELGRRLGYTGLDSFRAWLRDCKRIKK